jgi:hypothetical protein
VAGLNCFNGCGNFQAGKVVAFILFSFNLTPINWSAFQVPIPRIFVLNRVSFIISTHSTSQCMDNRTSNACENHVSP